MVPDKENIDNIVKIFFSIFNNTGQQQPAWETLHTICIPGTIIVKKTGLAEEVYNLPAFIEPRRKLLSDGTLSEFKEEETAEETKIIGNIAQRFSQYKKSGCLNGEHFRGSGNKFFQFIKTSGGWKINSMIWEDN